MTQNLVNNGNVIARTNNLIPKDAVINLLRMNGETERNGSRPRSPSLKDGRDDYSTKRTKLDAFERNRSDTKALALTATSIIVQERCPSDTTNTTSTKSEETTLASVQANGNRRPYPSEIKIVKLEERRWMCDVCKRAIFDNFVEACMHEIACKLSQNAVPMAVTEKSTWIPGQKLKRCPQTCTGVIEQQNPEGNEVPDIKSKEKTLDISLIPSDRKTLSDYNYLLTQNIALFEVTTKYSFSAGAVGIDIKDLPTTKVGLRCIHCTKESRHITAASFFPSTIGSIASGLGTIGARHFAGGKCPSISEETLEIMKAAKKTSQQQTRMQGRVGLDAYCRDLAKKQNISNNGNGGIYVERKNQHHLENDKNDKLKKDAEHLQFGEQVRNKTEMKKKETNNQFCEEVIRNEMRKDSVGIELASDITLAYNKVITILKKGDEALKKEPDKNGAAAYIKGDIEHFWECKNCNMLPFPWRASGSVVFCATAPTIDLVSKHLELCQGKRPLRIPRNAVIEKKQCEQGHSVRVVWRKIHNQIRKSKRIPRRPSIGERAKKTASCHTDVVEGVEDGPLVFEDDRALTTEFAHYTVLQLKKCYLTKPGGSRGNCPIGYPGLACSYCAGTTNERRFFYTSADHLRNSFSHIPAHLAVCSKCPGEVKQKIDDLKALRNKQKAHLKIGQHKMFIDRVWDRLHGPGGGIIHNPQIEEENDAEEASDEEGSLSSISIDLPCDSKDYQAESSDGRWLESREIAIDPTPSVLVFPEDRHMTTDYVYFSLLQLSQRLFCDTHEEKEKNTARPSDNTEKGMEITKAVTCTAGLICKHCMDESEAKIYVYDSAENFRISFAEISKHLMLCTKCPESIRAKLKTFKALRPTQEAYLRHDTHKALMDKVWKRLALFTKQNQLSSIPSTNSNENKTQSLVSEEDRQLVTEFTFYTMQQMMPCSLEHSGNGSRSMFEYGFPGLACIHCAGTPSARKFFYRNANILSGNWNHVPLHLLSCKHCPAIVKTALHRKKEKHATQKARLTRGSQRSFFNNIWGRLHLTRVDDIKSS